MARKLTNKWGVAQDLSSATEIKIKVRPGARWYSVVAVLGDCRELTVHTTPDWDEALLWLQRLTVEILVNGKDMKEDQITGRLVVDYD